MSESKDHQPTVGVQYRTIDVDDSGQRLDNYLLRELKGVPRTRLYRALRTGEIRVNKGRVQAGYRLVAGDILRLPPLYRPAPSEPAPVPRYLGAILAERMVYEDGDLVVINKPSGLAVHGGSGLSFGMIECLRQLRPDDRYLELVHRLDRDTSGLILIARRPAILRDLHHQLRENLIDKRYLALVAGSWPRHLRVVEAPLQKNTLRSGERMVRVAAAGKRSITEFSVVERLPGATLLEAKPITGRTHQIRVHARHAGFPLLGDEKYCNDSDRDFAREIGLKRLFLHARSLSLALPAVGRLNLESALDADLENILDKLRKSL